MAPHKPNKSFTSLHLHHNHHHHLLSLSSHSTLSSRSNLPRHLFTSLFIILILSPIVSSAIASLSSFTTAKPSSLLGSSLGSAASSALSSVASSGSGSGSSSGSLSSSSSSGSHGLGAASSFLYSMMGSAPKPSVANPFPIRTMIGNLYFRLRQHKTPIMIIPPLLRLMYQYRGPIMSGFNSAFKGMSASSGAVGSLAAKGASEAVGASLASAASNPIPSIAAAANTFGNAAGPGFMFPGPFAMGGAFPGVAGAAAAGLPGMMPAFAPPVF